MATQTVDSPVTATMFTRKMGEAMRQQSVCIEIPVTIQGSRNSGGDGNNPQGTKTFIEESRTMIVFPMGAVVRFSEPVSEGQVLILKNLRMNREVACRVVCSKTSANVKGFVEVEFVQPAVGFWGINFPGASANSQSASAAKAQSSSDEQAPKSSGVAPTSVRERTFQPPAFPSRTQTTNPKPTAQSVAPPPAAKLDTTPTPASPNAVDLNNAIAAAYSAPVEQVRKMEPAPTSSGAAGFNSETDVQTPKHSIVAPSQTIPIATADSITGSEATKSVDVDLAGLIVDEPKITEVRGTDQEKNVSTSAFDSQPVTGIVAAESRKSSPTLSRKISTPVVQPAVQLSRGMNFEIHPSRSSSGRTGMLVGVAAIIVISVAGVGAYWWYSGSKAPSHAAAISVAPKTSPALPAANPPAATQAATVPQDNSASAPNTQTAPPVINTPGQKTRSISVTNSPVGANNRTAPATTTNPPAQPPARRPNIIQSKIAAPVAPSGKSAGTNFIPTPDLTTPAPRTNSTASILGGISSLPAPPPAPVVRTSAPVASTSQPPRLLSSVPAVYPKMAAIRGDFGVVTVDAIVNEAGKVTSAKAISGPPSLRESSVAAVMQQRYSPAKLDGKPTSAHVTVNVEFKKKQ